MTYCHFRKVEREKLVGRQFFNKFMGKGTSISFSNSAQITLIFQQGKILMLR